VRPGPSERQLASWGLEPAWSRNLDVTDRDGVRRRWHVLDTATADPAGTILCVHGNPTWGYAFKSFLTDLGGRYRVIAPDQLGMGYSDRTERRRYATRVRDLGDLIATLDLDRRVPLYVAAHDWGGAIALGWAVDHADDVAGIVLCNTGIAVPEGRSAPAVIRLAASPLLLDAVCRGTPLFVEGTIGLSRRALSRSDREAFRAPYRSAPDRAAIADFVDDIPLTPGDPSEQALAAVAARLTTLDVPVLLAWGSRDPVFDDTFCADLAARLPRTVTHRFPAAGHLVMIEADVASVVATWIESLDDGEPPPDAAPPDTSAADAARADLAPAWSEIDARRDDDSVAVVDTSTGRRASWAELARHVDAVAASLCRAGLEPGDRVAMITPPGVDMIAVVYGTWRAGGVTVIADRGLGLSGLGAAIRAARPRWAIGPRRALRAAALMRWAPRAVRLDVADLLATDAAAPASWPPFDPDREAAVLFTSGATGPAKGVRYTGAQLAAQRDALGTLYSITPDDRLVAAFAPFALYGPALGIPTALPDCDVTRPATLTASALDAACRSVGATMAFGSPAALANVIATAGDRGRGALAGIGRLRVVMSAGAPVASEVLEGVAAMAPDAALHTPYGMTEVLPVADIELTEILQVADRSATEGVCVGRPVDGVTIRILPLGFDAGDPPPAVGEAATGEIVVDAPWMSAGYVNLWQVERDARPTIDGVTWHRSGDIGHLDHDGRLWVEGRAVHVISTPLGPLGPVPVERSVELALASGRRCAAVGVGPAGVQQLVVVVDGGEGGLAAPELADRVRAAVDHPVAAVLTVASLPVDVRHNAKIDRTLLAAWAADVVAGRRTRRRWR
jgi:acyl-coenzyme A synthetase/AMP-(fatty) acid ligase/pimeloyl-ACP methyl ester carboxylesterase